MKNSIIQCSITLKKRFLHSNNFLIYFYDSSVVRSFIFVHVDQNVEITPTRTSRKTVSKTVFNSRNNRVNVPQVLAFVVFLFKSSSFHVSI